MFLDRSFTYQMTIITEYVERCHGFDGFFTKENVAVLTEAASLDERLDEHHTKESIIGD